MDVTLMRELESLRCEVVRLRTLVGVHRRGPAIVEMAHVDALLMVQQHHLGLGTGRVEMKRLGMGKQRWAWAVAYLRFAGAVSSRVPNWRRGLVWRVDAGEAVRLVKEASDVSCTQLRVHKRVV
jgi:hypothetical protein